MRNCTSSGLSCFKWMDRGPILSAGREKNEDKVAVAGFRYNLLKLGVILLAYKLILKSLKLKPANAPDDTPDQGSFSR